MPLATLGALVVVDCGGVGGVGAAVVEVVFVAGAMCAEPEAAVDVDEEDVVDAEEDAAAAAAAA